MRSSNIAHCHEPKYRVTGANFFKVSSNTTHCHEPKYRDTGANFFKVSSNTAHCLEPKYRDKGANFFKEVFKDCSLPRVRIQRHRSKLLQGGLQNTAHCHEPKYGDTGANFFKEVFKNRSLPRAKIQRHRSKLLQGGLQTPLTATSQNTETQNQTSSRRFSKTAHCHEPKYRDTGANFFKEVFKHRSLPRAKIQRHRSKK